jgi:uncharacterized membrane protein
MAFCSKCGGSVADGAAFCPQCGTPAGGGGAVAVVPAAGGLNENVAGLLCYVVGWITGIIFLIIDKRPFVRFHAAQSIVVFGVLHLVSMVISYGFVGTLHFGFGAVGFWSVWVLILWAVNIVSLILWILLMVTAFQGKRVEIPIAANIAKSIVGRVQ